MPSVSPVLKTVQAAIDGLCRALNVFGVGERVHVPGHGPVPHRTEPYILVGGQLGRIVDEVGRAWYEALFVSPPGKPVVVSASGYLYEASALEPLAIPGVSVTKSSLVLGT